MRATYDESTRTWSLATSAIEAQFRLFPSGKFRLITLGRPGGKQWVSGGQPAMSPVYLNVDGSVLGLSTPWELAQTFSEGAGRSGIRHVIQLRNIQAEAEITLRAEVHPGQPFLRLWYSYRNTGAARHTVRAARFLNLRLDTEMRLMNALFVDQSRRGAPLMFEPHEWELRPGPEHSVTVEAGAHADNCTWLALRDSGENGLALGWEFNGRSTVRAEVTSDGKRLSITGGPDDLVAGVAAGDELVLPAAFIGLFEGDWDEAGYRTQRYVESVLAQPIPGSEFPYFMYNTWGYELNLNEQTLRRVAELAAYIGVEAFIVDLGWARQIGEWEEDTSKFPSGLAAFAGHVRSLGMKFGMHFVPVEAQATAPVLLEHPDWTSSVNNVYFTAESICLANRPTQQWLRQTAMSIVERYQPDWIAQDGENLVKECTKTSHTHNARNSNWANSVNGLDSFIEYMREQAPNTLWENNGDGGTMSTFGAVRNYVTATGCDACGVLPRRQATWGASYPFPPRYITRYTGEIPDKFATRSSMFGGAWILMQRLHELDPSQIELLRQEGAIYKALRPLIRDGKVYHLLNRPDGYSNEAIESFHPELNRGVIFVYRPDGGAASQMIFPKGLRAAGRYRISFQESRDTFVNTGANFMNEGISVRLPTHNFAEIIYIDPL